ncbi:unnamed protein product [Caenorhabditis nigoni]
MSLKSNWCDEPKSNHSSTASFVWVTNGDNAAESSPVRKEETMTLSGHGSRGLVCPHQIGPLVLVSASLVIMSFSVISLAFKTVSNTSPTSPLVSKTTETKHFSNSPLALSSLFTLHLPLSLSNHAREDNEAKPISEAKLKILV